MKKTSDNKILILANSDVGLYKFRKELIAELLEKGYKVYISLPNGGFVQPLVDRGCVFVDTPVDRRGINPKTDFKLFLVYTRLIRNINPDLIITYTIKPNIYGGLAARLLKKKYAVNITGLGTAFQKENVIKKIVVCLYRIALKRAKVVFFENEGNFKEILNQKITSKEQGYVLNGAGVNLLEYTYEDYPHEKNGIRFLFVGRVMKEKGIDELIKAATKIKEQYATVYFDIVGPLEDDYKEIIAGYEKKGVISYHGYQEDVRPFIVKSHCLVLPSYHEGMANTLLEAGAMGRPLLASNIPGCREAVINGKTGILFECGNSNALICAIEQFLSYTWEERKLAGKHQRDYIEEWFDKRDVVQKTIDRLFE